jgi:acyl-CoA synthetase (AMP-forming)/AMP-acid ligase II
MELLFNSFLKAVKQYPDHIAVKEFDKSISYKDLFRHIASLSYWLDEEGLEKGDRVGIHIPNSIDYIIAYYACWQANLVPVALNTLASPYEISNWIENSGCKLLFSRKLSNSLTGVPVYLLEAQSDTLKVSDNIVTEIGDGFLDRSVSGEDIAAIIYTSGTTGNPKGITLSHDNLAINIHAIVKSLAIVKEDVFLCVLPFFYSFGNSILHTHLASGATLVLLNQVMFPNEILKTIEHEACTGFAGVPSIYITLLKKTNFKDYNLSSLRYMTQAGGALSKEFIGQINHNLPGMNFVVMYGQTEASARISYLPPKFLASKPGSVGIGVDGVTVTVEGENGVECKKYETGEICVQGGNIMQGYWNNPEATQQVLRRGKLYTGDMGYKDDDGFLYIVGRQSEILKISEHRVSPYEIEEVILQHDAVEECAVIGCSHPQMGQFAKAFIVMSGEQVTGNQLKKYCKQYLASYKIPKEIEFVDALPKTSSGKIKRAQLAC